MGSVFISYRREDSQGQARALFQDLVTRLGRSAVFMDVDSIALGRDFREVLQERLATCDLMLVLIGPTWLSGTDATGRRRLDNPTDFVCLEIAAALKRKIPIAPLLLQGAQMPTAEQLPESIRELAYRNGFELSHNRWDSDVQELVKRLGLDARAAAPPARDPPPSAPGEAKATKKTFVALGAVALVALVIAGALYVLRGEPEPAGEAKVAAPAPAARAKEAAPTRVFDAAESQLRIATPGSYSASPFTIEGLDLAKDFRIEFQVGSSRSGGSTRYGIAWNYSPEDFMLFTLHSTGGGYFSIGPGRAPSRPWTRLAEGPIAINGESGFDTLQIARRGNALAFSVNGSEVWKTDDLRLTSGRFAFWVADYSEASIRSYTVHP